MEEVMSSENCGGKPADKRCRSVCNCIDASVSQVNDWRVPHLKSYWNLVVRLSWFVGGGRTGFGVEPD